MNKAISRRYLAFTKPGALKGAKTFYDAIRQEPKFKDVTFKQVKNVVENQEVYRQFQDQKVKFPKRKLKVGGIGLLHTADLIHMPLYEGSKYVLVSQDMFSKFMRAVPLEKKNAESVKNGLEKMYANGKKNWPKVMKTDNDAAFKNNKNWLHTKGVDLRIKTTGLNYPSLADPATKYIKRSLFKVMAVKNTKNWPKFLSTIVRVFNQSKNRVTHHIPADTSFEDDPDIRDILYPDEKNFRIEDYMKKQEKYQKMIKNSPFQPGALVYVDVKRDSFTKAYLRPHNMVYRIYRVDTTTLPFLYKLKTLNNVELPNYFYKEQLILAPKNLNIEAYFQDGKVLKTSPKKGKYLVGFKKLPR